MRKVKIRKRITSTTLKIKELDNFKDKDVEIVISTIDEPKSSQQNLEELLNIPAWENEEEIKVKSWQINEF